MNNGLTLRFISALAINPVATSTLYAGTQGGVFKTTDGGVTWQQTGPISPAGSPPAITAHPANQMVMAPAQASFTAAADGNPAPTWQWQVSTNGGGTWTDVADGAPYSGVTTATLTVNPTAVTLSGNLYRAVATNSAGAATTNAASLRINTISFFGGAGDQRGVSIVRDGATLLAVGAGSTSNGLVVRYATALGGPTGNASLAGTAFSGIAVGGSTAYVVGAAFVPACGSSDGSGGTENKAVFARFDLVPANPGHLGCSSPNYFPYRGHESHSAARLVVEGGSTFIYVAAGAEQTGNGQASPHILAKYDTAGAQVNAGGKRRLHLRRRREPADGRAVQRR
jgi:hypothetical protein